MNNNDFKFVVPATLEKSKEGKWIVRGLASAEVADRQGETIIQKGIDLSPIDQKRGFLNWDHDNSPESTVGLLTGYKRDNGKTYIEGELFQKHDRARAVHSIMESLEEHGSQAMGLSVEGKIVERDPINPKIIRKCLVKNVALTLNPIFSDSNVSLVKSFNAAESIEFDSDGANLVDSINLKIETKEEPTFTSSQVLDIVQKAMAMSPAQNVAPESRSGADALVTENLEKECSNTQENPKKKKKKMKSMEKSMYKSLMLDVLDQLQVLYPEYSRSMLWNAFKDRIEAKYEN